jgi:SAM-dependent methyltransferase
MKRFLKSIYAHAWLAFSRNITFLQDFLSLKRMQQRGNQRFPIQWRDRYPILDETTPRTAFDAHYIYHPAWAARIIANIHPGVHIDISSTLAFCTMLSAFIPVKFYDYRPANVNLEGLASERADLLKLPFEDGSIASLSCMHVVEHVGLGRYGDPLDPDGDLKAISELKRVLRPGGNLLFVTPVGKPRIQFNAHRVYSYEQIAEYFSGFEIRQFALVDDMAQFTINPELRDVNQQKYGCGCWWFVKPGQEVR